MGTPQQDKDMQHWLITGGTGFIGVPLVEAMVARGYRLYLLTRKPNKLPLPLQQLVSGGAPIKAIAELAEMPSDIVLKGCINLAGEGIADRPWSKSRKQILEHSRIDLTRNLVDWLNNQRKPIDVFISGSAIGVYGYHQEQWLDETAEVNGSDYGSMLCRNWEKEAGKLCQGMSSKEKAEGTRIIHLRTGLVLGKGGMLKRMAPAFKLGLGGRLGDGQQYMSWVHLDDLIAIILFAIDHPNIRGSINAVAETPETNENFTQQLAATFKRPCFFHVPAFILKIALGEMSDLLLKGQRIKPRVLIEQGYKFKFSDLQTAFTNIFKK